MKINPKDAESWYNKAVRLYNFDWLDETIECYDKTLKTNSQHTLAWLSKGSFLERRDEREVSIACYRGFIEVAPAEYSNLTNGIRQRLRELES